MLVATDCLSEGVNLQEQFQAVVHYDLAWNPTRHEQREGRVDRFGQPADIVRAVTIYGRDNRIDGIVLDVLLRKHQAIREGDRRRRSRCLTAANAVVEALLEGLAAPRQRLRRRAARPSTASPTSARRTLDGRGSPPRSRSAARAPSTPSQASAPRTSRARSTRSAPRSAPPPTSSLRTGEPRARSAPRSPTTPGRVHRHHRRLPLRRCGTRCHRAPGPAERSAATLPVARGGRRARPHRPRRRGRRLATSSTRPSTLLTARGTVPAARSPRRGHAQHGGEQPHDAAPGAATGSISTFPAGDGMRRR